MCLLGRCGGGILLLLLLYPNLWSRSLSGSIGFFYKLFKNAPHSRPDERTGTGEGCLACKFTEKIRKMLERHLRCSL